MVSVGQRLRQGETGTTCLGTAGRLKAGAGAPGDWEMTLVLAGGFSVASASAQHCAWVPKESLQRERAEESVKGRILKTGDHTLCIYFYFFYLIHFIPLQQLQSDKQSCTITSEFFKMHALAYGMVNFIYPLG